MKYSIKEEVLWTGICSEERFFSEFVHKQVAFYTTVIIAIFAATIAGIMEAEDGHDFLVLMAGPIVIIAISLIAIRGVHSYYRRQIEAITIRAKLEADYGLTQSREGSLIWPNEGLINTRHIENRNRFSSSHEFSEHMQKRGYQRTVNFLFNAFISIAFLIATGLFYSFVSETWGGGILIKSGI